MLPILHRLLHVLKEAAFHRHSLHLKNETLLPVLVRLLLLAAATNIDVLLVLEKVS